MTKKTNYNKLFVAIKIKKETLKILKALRGYEGCITIDDVITLFIKKYKVLKGVYDEKEEKTL